MSRSVPLGRTPVPFLTSFTAGALVGSLFWLLRTPTPVPPIVGLVGLLGITLGEQGMLRLLRTVRVHGRRSLDPEDSSVADPPSAEQQ